MTTPIHQADIAIVGSGVAGAMLAHELAADGLNVLLLEAGPRLSREQIFDRFQSSYIGQNVSAPYPNTGLAPRPEGSEQDRYHLQNGPTPFISNYVRLVGGTTWHWGAVTPRFLESDFQMKNQFNVGEDWPISYADMEPYYAKAEREMSVSGPEENPFNSPRSTPYPLPPQIMSYMDRYIQEQAAAIGMEFTLLPVARNSRASDGRPACQGFGNCIPICPSGAQYAGMMHVDKAEQAGARVLDNALATRLDVGQDGAVNALSLRRPDGSTERVAAELFVLAANAVETPRLMLLSASETLPRGLGNSSDQVGRNLMSHPGFDAQMTIKDPVYAGRGPRNSMAFQTPREGPHRKKNAAYYLALVNAVDVPGNAITLLNKGLMGPELDQALRDNVSRSLSMHAKCEQLPSPDNRLQLDIQEKDTAGLPKVRFSYHLDEYTKSGLQQARADLEKLSQHLGAPSVKYFAETLSTHPMGTARMGDSAQNSVVDPEGRSHDHKNLFIVGGAVFPSGGTAPPTLTIAALSLRLADAIRRQLGHQLS